MRTSFFITIFVTLITGSHAFSGVLVGNGGDSIYCQKTGDVGKFRYSGFYVLDYALSFPNDPSVLVKISSLQGSLDRIEKLLRSHAPEAVASFLSFRAAFKPEPFVETDERAWIASQRPLINIRDEWARQFPLNCRFHKRNKAFYGIHQQTVVRRRASNGRVSYQYDAAIVGDYLTQSDPTQASVLFIHEWLWDFYEGDRFGAPKIRSANLFLHTLDAEKASTAEFVTKVFHAKMSSSARSD